MLGWEGIKCQRFIDMLTNQPAAVLSFIASSFPITSRAFAWPKFTNLKINCMRLNNLRGRNRA